MQQHTPPPSSNHRDHEQPCQEHHVNIGQQFVLPRQEIENVVSPDSVIPTTSSSSLHRSSKGATPKGDEIIDPQPSLQSDMTDTFGLQSNADTPPLAPPPCDNNIPLPDGTVINNEKAESTVIVLGTQDINTPESPTSPAQSQGEQAIKIVSSSSSPTVPAIQRSKALQNEQGITHFNPNSATAERHDSDSEPDGSAPSPVNFDINGNVNIIPPFNLAHSDPGADSAGAVNIGLYGDVIAPSTTPQFTSATSPPTPLNVDANGNLIPSTSAQFKAARSASSNAPPAINVNANGDMIPPLHPQFDPATSNIYAFMEEDGTGPEFFDNCSPRHTKNINNTNGAPFETRREAKENGGGDYGAEFLFNDYELDLPSTSTPGSGMQEGRVEASKMGQVENPLQKRGRHTVITGHLPEDNEYAIAEKNLGVKMCSLKWAGTSVVGLSREEAFARDLQQFLAEIHLTGYKVPVIGGGPLNLFTLMREVLLLGGVINVVRKRAFRIVGQQLELPKSCTSAAFVLKNAYTRLLFYYERKLVFDEIPPENPARNVNIKQIVAANKERDKMEAKLRNVAARHNNSGNGASFGSGFCVPEYDGGDNNKKRSLLMSNNRNSNNNNITAASIPPESPSSYILDHGNGSDDYGERENSHTPKRTRYCYPMGGSKAGLLNDNNNINSNNNNNGGGGSGLGNINNNNNNNVTEKEVNMTEMTPMGTAADYQTSQDYYMSLLSWVGLD